MGGCVQPHSFAYGNPVVPVPFIEESIPSPLNGLGILSTINGHRCVDLFLDSQLYSVGLYIYPYASVTLFWWLQLCSKFWNQKYKSSNFVVLFQECFGYSGPLAIPYEFGCWLFHFYKKVAGIWQGLHWIHSSLWVVLTS